MGEDRPSTGRTDEANRLRNRQRPEGNVALGQGLKGKGRGLKGKVPGLTGGEVAYSAVHKGFYLLAGLAKPVVVKQHLPIAGDLGIQHQPLVCTPSDSPTNPSALPYRSNAVAGTRTEDELVTHT